jgi:hypothetical protein
VQKICLERQPEQQAAARLAEVRKRAATAFSEALEKAGKEAFESGASDDE